MEHIDLAVRTLFQEFQESVLKRTDLERSLKQAGTYTRKKIRGNEYWYLQRYLGGKIIQEYLGASTPRLKEKILKEREASFQDRALLKQMLKDESRRGAMLRRGGLPSADPFTACVLERLAEKKLIDEKGILIGSYAFQTYSGMLGVLFESELLRTQDIDVVRESNVEIAVSDIVDLQELLEKGKRHFRAVPSFSAKGFSSSFLGPRGIRIDLLTPLIGKPRGVMRVPGIINAGAQPLRFLDFLIQDPIRTVLIQPKGGIAVTVPSPARYAVHKLIVSQYRAQTELAKRRKDLLQAAQLITALNEENPEELKEALQEAKKRGNKWKRAIEKSLASM